MIEGSVSPQDISSTQGMTGSVPTLEVVQVDDSLWARDELDQLPRRVRRRVRREHSLGSWSSCPSTSRLSSRCSGTVSMTSCASDTACSTPSANVTEPFPERPDAILASRYSAASSRWPGEGSYTLTAAPPAAEMLRDAPSHRARPDHGDPHEPVLRAKSHVCRLRIHDAALDTGVKKRRGFCTIIASICASWMPASRRAGRTDWEINR